MEDRYMIKLFKPTDTIFATNGDRIIRKAINNTNIAYLIIISIMYH